ncbi:DUF2059 domain-containing protein [Pseudoxanthobacter sp.]|uniref:DUF2059 domain-containing protein n=1 Tax=Pseudoxanthobacter sp. TaxID=1925742 RepID=UPI002FDFB379
MTAHQSRRPTIAAACILALAGAFAAGPALAQSDAPAAGQAAAKDAPRTYSPEILSLAQQAIDASQSVAGFDEILPRVAEQTKALYVRSNPLLASDIDAVTNEVALSLAPQRRELDRTLEEVWANRFSADELKEIIAFYQSPVGKKLAQLSPEIVALSIGAAKQWQDKIATEMMTQVRIALQKKGHKL